MQYIKYVENTDACSQLHKRILMKCGSISAMLGKCCQGGFLLHGGPSSLLHTHAQNRGFIL